MTLRMALTPLLLLLLLQLHARGSARPDSILCRPAVKHHTLLFTHLVMLQRRWPAEQCGMRSRAATAPPVLQHGD
jgi:hypothetical protein